MVLDSFDGFCSLWPGADPFLFLNQLQISSAEKIRLKKKKRNSCPPLPFKIFRYGTGFAA